VIVAATGEAAMPNQIRSSCSNRGVGYADSWILTDTMSVSFRDPGSLITLLHHELCQNMYLTMY
jgi:hypothetical protein